MTSRRKSIKLPLVGSINLKSKTTWLIGGAILLGGLYFLASTGRKTGFGPLDYAAGQFEDIYEDYLGPLGPGGVPIAPKPMTAAPVVPSASARGMAFDDMVFSGAYATDAPLPYTDWWNNDISDDDRIIVA